MVGDDLRMEDADISALIDLLQAGKIRRSTLRQFISTFADDYPLKPKKRVKSSSSESIESENSPKIPIKKIVLNDNCPSSPRVILIDIVNEHGNDFIKSSVEKISGKRTSSPISRPSKRKKTRKNEETRDSNNSNWHMSPSDTSGLRDSSEDSFNASLCKRELRKSSRREPRTRHHVSVQGVLDKYTIGSVLIRNYRKSGTLTDDGRKALVKIITKELIANDFITEQNSVFERLAKEIHDIFPTERVDTYYIKPLSMYSSWDGKPKRSRGRLVNKFRFEIQKFKKDYDDYEIPLRKKTRAVTTRTALMRNELQTRMEQNHPVLAYLGLSCTQNCCINTPKKIFQA